MTPILEARALSRNYPYSRGAFRRAATVRALAGVSFSLFPGRTLAVVGESGSGKSTLARLLTLIEKPTAGALIVEGQDVAAVDASRRRRLRQDIQIVFQNPYGSLNPRQKIGRALEEPLLVNTTMSAREREAAALAIMDKVGLRREYYHRYPHMFSGGQRQRIAIARALIRNAPIILLDEPTAALDSESERFVQDAMGKLITGRTTLVIAHRLHTITQADRIHVVEKGTIVESGRHADLLAAGGRYAHFYRLRFVRGPAEGLPDVSIVPG